MIKTLTRDDIADILNGATIFGAGGGGELAEGFELIDAAIAAGKTFRLATLDDVPDDALICTPYLLGAISDLPPEEAQLYAGLPQTDTHPILLAYRRLQTLLDKPIYGAVPCELGGSNTAVPFFVAAMEGGVVVDADPAGRAVPEITHASYYLAGLPAAPIAAAVMILPLWTTPCLPKRCAPPSSPARSVRRNHWGRFGGKDALILCVCQRKSPVPPKGSLLSPDRSAPAIGAPMRALPLGRLRSAAMAHSRDKTTG